MNTITISDDDHEDLMENLSAIDLKELSNLNEFNFTSKFSAFLLKACSLKLYRPISDDYDCKQAVQCCRLSYESEILSNESLFVNEERVINKKRNRYFRLMSLLFYIFVLYIVIKFFVLTILSAKQNRLQKQLTLSLRKKLSLNEDEECLFNASINVFDDLEEKAELESVLKWFNLLGWPFESLTAASIYASYLVISISIIYFFSGAILMGLRKPEMDVLGFLFSPIGERIRMRENLMQSIDTLCESMENAHYNDKLLRDSIDLFVHNFLLDYSLMLEEIGGHQMPQEGCDIILPKTFRFRREMEKFRSSLKRKALAIVKPANLEASWHESITKMGMILICYDSFATISTSLLMLIMMTLGESVVRTDYRLRQLKCEESSRGAILIDLPLHMKNKLILANEEEEILARSHLIETSASNSFNLAELKYFLKLTNIQTMIEFLPATLFCSFWVSFYFNLYILSYFHRLKWMNQIEKQLRECCQIFDIINQNLDKTSNEEKSNVELKNKLLETYLNYELFRRFNVNYIASANLLIAQAGIFSGTNFVLCYYIADYIDSNSYLILVFISILQGLFLNFYLISSAYTTAIVRKLVKQIFLLQTKLIPEGSDSGFILDSWRRQTLTESEARKFFAPTFIGKYLSYIECLTLNFYFAVLFIILMRSNKMIT